MFKGKTKYQNHYPPSWVESVVTSRKKASRIAQTQSSQVWEANMSDEDDFMCDDDEEYNLVS